MRACRLFPFVLLVAGPGCTGADPPAEPLKGVAIQTDGLAERQAALAKFVTSAKGRPMTGSGLAGVAGGAVVRVTADKPQEVLLPVPQVADGQVPIGYFIESTPADAVTEYRLHRREGGDVALVVRLVGKKQEVLLAWSAVVLLGPKVGAADTTPEEPYRKATACVQSAADEVKTLAEALWPKSGKATEFAANIQKHVAGMKRANRPQSLDAVGILKSGENSICTANANLAAALMRAKGIACRSVAVVPPTGQRLEMHRIVEFADAGRWVRFDPSGLTADIPAKPWQSIVVARPTIADEEAAMEPRLAAMRGCPYGQEIELLTPGVMLFGQDFFWTQAAPLAEFEPTDDAARLAVQAWDTYLKSGQLSAGQLRAGSAKSAGELARAFEAK